MGREDERSSPPPSGHASSLTPPPSLLRRRWILISLTALALFLFLILQFYSSPSSSSPSSSSFSSDHHQERKDQCKYNENNDPTATSTAELFYLQTISGVHYDGGHWFHVAENFMVQHSILRASHSEGKTPEVYFLTDRGEAAHPFPVRSVTSLHSRLSLLPTLPSLPCRQ